MYSILLMLIPSLTRLYLSGTCSDPNSVENRVGKDAFKDVSLSVDFSRIELVE